MMFYNHELLKPPCLIFKPLVLSEKALKYFGKEKQKPEFNINLQFDNSQALINIESNEKYFGRIALNTVNANCGSLFISDLHSKYQRLGIGSSILKTVEHYALLAGYTMIFGNVPKYSQMFSTNDPMRFFEKMGYKPMGEDYINVRSGNINRWFSKIIQLPQKDDEE